ncbi:MAG: TolC family protein [Candidatus Eisenbacteria bacterium]
MPGDTVLTLAWLEKHVLERNPTLAAMRAAREESQAQARQAGAIEDPMLDLMVAPRSLASGAVDPAYRVGVSQRVPLFGQRGLRRQAAAAEAEAIGYDLETARLDLLREARVAFYDDYRTARSQETNRELVGLLRRFHRVALAKYASGAVAQGDPLQAEVELAMLRHQSVVLERQRIVVRAQLKALLHAPSESELPAPPRTLPRPDSLAAENPDEIRRHAPWPELRAAESRIEARRSRLMLARRQRLPEFTLGIAYDRFWSEPELRGTVGLSFNLPIHRGRLGATEREARAGLARAEHERDAVRDGIEKELATASARFREAGHEVHIMREEVVPATERALGAVVSAYEANRGDFLALLTATRDLARARLGLHEALAMLHAAHADLLRAAAADAPVPAPEELP